MGFSYQRSSQLFEQTKNYIPGGVNSPVRAFKGVGGTPVLMEKADGAYLHDIDGNTYIDYINSWGPMILGHNHPEVTEALKLQIDKGTSFGTPTELETQIAQLIVDNISHVDKIRMVNSGTEACMSAVRLARGYTNKEKIIKFIGCYHGHSDSFLIEAGSGAATFGTPSSPGVTKGTAKDTLLANFNDLEAVKTLFKENDNQIAAIILEPIAGNMGCVLPTDSFIKGLRELCDSHDSILIFDEVMTGFRLSFGGAAQTLGITPDLVCYGKIIGGGLPVGAFGGKKDIMSQLAPEGPVYQAGTLSGNPLAMTAGLKTLEILLKNPSIYKNLEKNTCFLDQEIDAILNQKGIEHSQNRKGSMYSVFFTEEKVIDFETSKLANNDTFKKFFHHMLENGVYLPPSSFETWFISNAIDEKAMEKTLETIRKF